MALTSQIQASPLSPVPESESADLSHPNEELVKCSSTPGRPSAASAFHEFVSSLIPTQRNRRRSIRTVVIFAHPDDECIGLGALLPDLADPWLVCVTDGAPPSPADAQRAGCRDSTTYAALRRMELEQAAAKAGVARSRISGLGLGDQRASFEFSALIPSLTSLLARLSPDVVVTHPYEGGHPDHDATAFGVHVARQLLARQSRHVPAIVEMTSYHNHAGAIAWGEFLPGSPRILTIPLEASTRSRKQRLLACYRSQALMLDHVPLEAERFRSAPEYNFTAPPHPGRLYYEQFDWGIAGVEWRERAAAALREFGFPP